MLFRQEILDGIAAGRVTLAYRRWRKAPPAAGSTLRTAVGVLVFDSVAIVDEGDISAEDIRRTGLTREALRASIAGEGRLIRIELRLAGADPRLALRERLPTTDEIAALVSRLARLDATSAPWTREYLQTIADRPGVVSHVLAAAVGCEQAPFKRRVRQLKELGLTESLEVGYQLSPRGRAMLAAIAPAGRP